VSESARDPFPPTADSDRYVPRAASERALAELRRALGDGATRILLHGPPGIGKTLLARVLQTRSGPDFRFAEASYPALPLTDLCAWVLRELGEDAGSDPAGALLELASRDRTRPLLLLVDDAHSLPRETASELGTLTDRAGGALRVLAVTTDGDRASALDDALCPERDVRIDQPMSLDELGDYVSARLDAAAVPEDVRRRFDADALARLHDESEGLPGRLHHGATALLLGRRPPEPRDPESSPPPDPIESAPPSTSSRPASPPPAEPASATGDEEARGSRLGPIAIALLVAFGLGVWLLAREAPDTGLQPPTPAPQPSAATPPAPEVPTASAEVPRPGPDTPPDPAPPKPPTAVPEPAFSVHVNATPWAEIELDGSALGVTPLAAIAVEPGRHRFRVRMADGRILQRDVILSPERRHLVFE
jgi:type II secretory pathway predicted ATPase ExeA